MLQDKHSPAICTNSFSAVLQWLQCCKGGRVAVGGSLESSQGHLPYQYSANPLGSPAALLLAQFRAVPFFFLGEFNDLLHEANHR